MTKNWTMNAKQMEFVELLKAMGGSATLLELEAVKGVKVATGSVNTLVTKGVVSTEDTEVAYTVTETYKFGETTFTREVSKKKAVKKYSLVGYESESVLEDQHATPAG